MRVREAIGAYSLDVFSLPDGRAEAVLREGPKVLMSTYIPKGDFQQQAAAARQKAKMKIAEAQAPAYAYMNQAQFNAQWRAGDNARRMTLAKKHPGWAAAILGGKEKLDHFMAGQVWKAALALTGDPVLAVKVRIDRSRGLAAQLQATENRLGPNTLPQQGPRLRITQAEAMRKAEAHYAQANPGVQYTLKWTKPLKQIIEPRQNEPYWRGEIEVSRPGWGTVRWWMFVNDVRAYYTGEHYSRRPSRT